MNKNLLSMAVAAALVAPMSAMSASNVTLYGKAHLSQDYADVDSLAGQFPGDLRAPFNGWDTVSRASRLGVKGSEDLGGGLKAIFKMEFGISMSDRNSDINDNDRGSISMRNTYVGLAGDWGTALIGRHDTPLKISTGRLDLFSDYMADYNATVGFVDARADNAVAYISPTLFGGLTLAGAMISPGGSTVVGDGNSGADGIADAYSVAAMYSNGPFFVSGAYEFYKDDVVSATAPDDFKLWRIGVGFNWNAFTINGIYEGHKNDPTTGFNDDPALYQIQGQWKFGNNALKGMWGTYDGDDARSHDTWAVGLDHNFSKRTTAYLLYTDYSSDYRESDWKGGSLGVIHKF